MLTITQAEVSSVRNFQNQIKGNPRLFTLQIKTVDGKFVKYTRTLDDMNKINLDDLNNRKKIENATVVFYIKGNHKPQLISINGTNIKNEQFDKSEGGQTYFRPGSIDSTYKSRE